MLTTLLLCLPALLARVPIMPKGGVKSAQPSKTAPVPGAKTKVYNVNILVPPEYLEAYQQSHPSLGADLRTVALAVESTFNNSTLARSNGYQVHFNLKETEDNPVLLKMGPQSCEGSVTQILNLLNDVNNYDNTNHYILMLPCLPDIYMEVFNSVKLNIPIIEYQANVECTRRIAVFFEMSYPHMFSSFSNALVKVLGAPLDDYNVVTESNHGDSGLQVSVTMKDDTVYGILNGKCFLRGK